MIGRPNIGALKQLFVSFDQTLHRPMKPSSDLAPCTAPVTAHHLPAESAGPISWNGNS
jgi:hypothetical protein